MGLRHVCERFRFLCGLAPVFFFFFEYVVDWCFLYLVDRSDDWIEKSVR